MLPSDNNSGTRQNIVPKIIAPAARKRFTTPASPGTTDLRRLKDPAVVFMPKNKDETWNKKLDYAKPSDAMVAMLSFLNKKSVNYKGNYLFITNSLLRG